MDKIKKPIYFDYNASTPIAADVIQVMLPYLTHAYGNPSSNHWASADASKGLTIARGQVADLIGASEDEIIFTSGGSEANNLAIKGSYFSALAKGLNHFITTAIEHPATLSTCQFLEKLGAEISIIPVDSYGRVSVDKIESAITDKTALISVMHANNEVGSVQPVEEIGQIAKRYGVLFHLDAAQSAGKIFIDVKHLNIDLLSLAGHKLYAPKGVGALYVRKGVELTPLIHGGGHEKGFRAGTESAFLASGLGKACQLAKDLDSMVVIQKLRDYFWLKLSSLFNDKVIRNGHPKFVLPNTLSVSFKGYNGAEILAALDGVAASLGSACHQGMSKPSPVLEAMGVQPEHAFGTIRFSLGKNNIKEEIDITISMLKTFIQSIDSKAAKN